MRESFYFYMAHSLDALLMMEHHKRKCLTISNELVRETQGINVSIQESLLFNG